MGTLRYKIISGQYLGHHKKKNVLFDFLPSFTYTLGGIREERHSMFFIIFLFPGNCHSEPDAELITGFNLKSFIVKFRLYKAANHFPTLSAMGLR